MTASAVAALTKVIAELPAISKGDKSPQGYTYRGIEAITKQLQPLLARHGVVIVPSATITNVVPSPGMKESWQDIYMTVQWSVFGPEGDCLTACTTGIGRDNADKGANKAQTQAYKYLLLHLLCIADAKDDSDGQSYDNGRHERSAPSPEQLLWDRITTVGKSDKGMAAALKAEAEQWGQKLTFTALQAEPRMAEALRAVLDGATPNHVAVQDATHDERTSHA